MKFWDCWLVSYLQLFPLIPPVRIDRRGERTCGPIRDLRGDRQINFDSIKWFDNRFAPYYLMAGLISGLCAMAEQAVDQTIWELANVELGA